MAEAAKRNVRNLTLVNSNQEYSVTCTDGCKAITFQCRTAADCYLAPIAGGVPPGAGTYMTMKAGGSFGPVNGLKSGENTWYFSSLIAGVVIEIWEEF